MRNDDKRTRQLIDGLTPSALARLAIESARQALAAGGETDEAFAREIGFRARLLSGANAEEYRESISRATTVRLAAIGAIQVAGPLTVASVASESAAAGWREAAMLAEWLTQATELMLSTFEEATNAEAFEGDEVLLTIETLRSLSTLAKGYATHATQRGAEWSEVHAAARVALAEITARAIDDDESIRSDLGVGALPEPWREALRTPNLDGLTACFPGLGDAGGTEAP